jgi:hypothetical protein
MIERLLKEVSTSRKIGKFNEDCAEFIDDGKVVREAFEDSEESIAGLGKSCKEKVTYDSLGMMIPF